LEDKSETFFMGKTFFFRGGQGGRNIIRVKKGKNGPDCLESNPRRREWCFFSGILAQPKGQGVPGPADFRKGQSPRQIRKREVTSEQGTNRID